MRQSSSLALGNQRGPLLSYGVAHGLHGPKVGISRSLAPSRPFLRPPASNSNKTGSTGSPKLPPRSLNLGFEVLIALACGIVGFKASRLADYSMLFLPYPTLRQSSAATVCPLASSSKTLGTIDTPTTGSNGAVNEAIVTGKSLDQRITERLAQQQQLRDGMLEDFDDSATRAETSTNEQRQTTAEPSPEQRAVFLRAIGRTSHSLWRLGWAIAELPLHAMDLLLPNTVLVSAPSTTATTTKAHAPTAAASSQSSTPPATTATQAGVVPTATASVDTSPTLVMATAPTVSGLAVTYADGSMPINNPAHALVEASMAFSMMAQAEGLKGQLQGTMHAVQKAASSAWPQLQCMLPSGPAAGAGFTGMHVNATMAMVCFSLAVWLSTWVAVLLGSATARAVARATGLHFGKPMPSAQYFGSYGIPPAPPARPGHACSATIPSLAASGSYAAVASAAVSVAAASAAAAAPVKAVAASKAAATAGKPDANKPAQDTSAPPAAAATDQALLNKAISSSSKTKKGAASSPAVTPGCVAQAGSMTVGLGMYRNFLGEDPVCGFDCLLTSEGLPPMGPPVWMPEAHVQRLADPGIMSQTDKAAVGEEEGAVSPLAATLLVQKYRDMEGSFFHTTLPPLGPVAYLSDLVITKDKMKQDDKKSAKTARKIASTEVSPATPAPADPAGSQCTAEGTSNLMVERYRELEAGCFVYGYPMVGPAPDMWVHKGARPGQGQAARGAGAAAEQAGSASAGTLDPSLAAEMTATPTTTTSHPSHPNELSDELAEVMRAIDDAALAAAAAQQRAASLAALAAPLPLPLTAIGAEAEAEEEMGPADKDGPAAGPVAAAAAPAASGKQAVAAVVPGQKDLGADGQAWPLPVKQWRKVVPPQQTATADTAKEPPAPAKPNAPATATVAANPTASATPPSFADAGTAFTAGMPSFGPDDVVVWDLDSTPLGPACELAMPLAYPLSVPLALPLRPNPTAAGSAKVAASAPSTAATSCVSGQQLGGDRSAASDSTPEFDYELGYEFEAVGGLSGPAADMKCILDCLKQQHQQIEELLAAAGVSVEAPVMTLPPAAGAAPAEAPALPATADGEQCVRGDVSKETAGDKDAAYPVSVPMALPLRPDPTTAGSAEAPDTAPWTVKSSHQSSRHVKGQQVGGDRGAMYQSADVSAELRVHMIQEGLAAACKSVDQHMLIHPPAAFAAPAEVTAALPAANDEQELKQQDELTDMAGAKIAAAAAAAVAQAAANASTSSLGAIVEANQMAAQACPPSRRSLRRHIKDEEQENDMLGQATGMQQVKASVAGMQTQESLPPDLIRVLEECSVPAVHNECFVPAVHNECSVPAVHIECSVPAVHIEAGKESTVPGDATETREPLTAKAAPAASEDLSELAKAWFARVATQQQQHKAQSMAARTAAAQRRETLLRLQRALLHPRHIPMHERAWAAASDFAAPSFSPAPYEAAAVLLLGEWPPAPQRTWQCKSREEIELELAARARCYASLLSTHGEGWPEVLLTHGSLAAEACASADSDAHADWDMTDQGDPLQMLALVRMMAQPAVLARAEQQLRAAAAASASGSDALKSCRSRRLQMAAVTGSMVEDGGPSAAGTGAAPRPGQVEQQQQQALAAMEALESHVHAVDEAAGVQQQQQQQQLQDPGALAPAPAALAHGAGVGSAPRPTRRKRSTQVMRTPAVAVRYSDLFTPPATLTAAEVVKPVAQPPAASSQVVPKAANTPSTTSNSRRRSASSNKDASMAPPAAPSSAQATQYLESRASQAAYCGRLFNGMPATDIPDPATDKKVAPSTVEAGGLSADDEMTATYAFGMRRKLPSKHARDKRSGGGSSSSGKDTDGTDPWVDALKSQLESTLQGNCEQSSSGNNTPASSTLAPFLLASMATKAPAKAKPTGLPADNRLRSPKPGCGTSGPLLPAALLKGAVEEPASKPTTTPKQAGADSAAAAAAGAAAASLDAAGAAAVPAEVLAALDSAPGQWLVERLSMVAAAATSSTPTIPAATEAAPAEAMSSLTSASGQGLVQRLSMIADAATAPAPASSSSAGRFMSTDEGWRRRLEKLQVEWDQATDPDHRQRVQIETLKLMVEKGGASLPPTEQVQTPVGIPTEAAAATPAAGMQSLAMPQQQAEELAPEQQQRQADADARADALQSSQFRARRGRRSVSAWEEVVEYARAAGHLQEEEPETEDTDKEETVSRKTSDAPPAAEASTDLIPSGNTALAPRPSTAVVKSAPTALTHGSVKSLGKATSQAHTWPPQPAGPARLHAMGLDVDVDVQVQTNMTHGSVGTSDGQLAQLETSHIAGQLSAADNVVPVGDPQVKPSGPSAPQAVDRPDGRGGAVARGRAPSAFKPRGLGSTFAPLPRWPIVGRVRPDAAVPAAPPPIHVPSLLAGLPPAPAPAPAAETDSQASVLLQPPSAAAAAPSAAPSIAACAVPVVPPRAAPEAAPLQVTPAVMEEEEEDGDMEGAAPTTKSTADTSSTTSSSWPSVAPASAVAMRPAQGSIRPARSISRHAPAPAVATAVPLTTAAAGISTPLAAAAAAPVPVMWPAVSSAQPKGAQQQDNLLLVDADEEDGDMEDAPVHKMPQSPLMHPSRPLHMTVAPPTPALAADAAKPAATAAAAAALAVHVVAAACNASVLSKQQVVDKEEEEDGDMDDDDVVTRISMLHSSLIAPRSLPLASTPTPTTTSSTVGGSRLQIIGAAKPTTSPSPMWWPGKFAGAEAPHIPARAQGLHTTASNTTQGGCSSRVSSSSSSSSSVGIAGGLSSDVQEEDGDMV